MIAASEREATVAGLFQPDVLLPSQCADARKPFIPSGEVRLMLAILEDALEVIAKGVHTSRASIPSNRAHLDRQQQHQLDAAVQWVRANEPDWVFSFVTICERLGLDPAAVRAAVLK
jgi:hypothetical protein